jgi:hypothetical protein
MYARAERFRRCLVAKHFLQKAREQPAVLAVCFPYEQLNRARKVFALR